MPRLPKPPEGDRFFARILGARLECPRCGHMDQFHTKGQAGAKRPPAGARSPVGWNPLTGRWVCPGCRLGFVLGLLAWPVAPGGQAGGTLPRDQVPSVRQLAQLRAQGGGQWMRDKLKGFRADGSNITSSGEHYEDCTGPEVQRMDLGDGDWVDQCGNCGAVVWTSDGKP